MHTHNNTHPHTRKTQHPGILICHGHGWWIYNVKFSYCINTTELSGVKHKRAALVSANADVHMQFLSRSLPSFPVTQLFFIYILLSCLSLWVIKPWKREWEKDGFGGGRGGPAVPQWWKWVFPKLLLTYLMTHNSCLNTPWSPLQWLVWIDSDKNRDGFKFLMKLQLRHQKKKWAWGRASSDQKETTRMWGGNSWKVNSTLWALILGICHRI